jgi:hypothetical protein
VLASVLAGVLAERAGALRRLTACGLGEKQLDQEFYSGLYERLLHTRKQSRSPTPRQMVIPIHPG